MAWRSLLLGWFLLASTHLLRAVENSSTSTFNETAPTGNDITNWLTGWSQPTVQPTGTTYTTGWNYVGSVAGSGSQASGVYLGNGWVITCGHVGPGSFKLNGTTYPYVANSMHSFTTTVTTTVTSSSGTLVSTGTATDPADFILFQVSPAPVLPQINIRQSDPVVNSSHVAMIGYGDGASLTNETWGYDLVSYATSQIVSLLGYTSNDFEIVNGTSSEYEVVSGDSGGAEFIYNSTTKGWELAGLNEAELTSNGTQVGSAFIQLDNSTFSNTTTDASTGNKTTLSGTTTYATQIAQVLAPAPSDTPAMPLWSLIVLSGLLGLVAIPRKSLL